MTILDSLTKHKSYNDQNVYSLSEIKEKFKVLEIGSGYLAITESDDAVSFGVFDFNYSDDTGEYISVQFHGCGYSGALRECRHTYWGENGYIFYPNGNLISLAFKELSKYFDEMN